MTLSGRNYITCRSVDAAATIQLLLNTDRDKDKG